MRSWMLALIVAALALVAVSGAVTGKGRAQRAADLAAISGARSMRDDLPRLLSPPVLPTGLPNPLHMELAVYLLRARAAALRASAANGVSRSRLRISFPDRLSFAPVRVRAVVSARVEGSAIEASAVAEAAAPASAGSMPAMGSGGGYSGPLAYRQGEGMRPDVAAAFDRMSAAAARTGVALAVSSGFRSDSEQAALFAAHPDPRWVAPPGHSLHRCATELDLGPAAAYGWLAANAPGFGFVQRYSWEPWHYGYATGPTPCSDAGNAAGGGDSSLAAAGGLPSFVPPRFRPSLLHSAARWSVSAGLLAAQAASRAGLRVILAEQDFECGGRLLATNTLINDAPVTVWFASLLGELAASRSVRLLTATTCFGLYDHGMAGLLQRIDLGNKPSAVRQRYWRVHARQTLLATGAIEQPLVFEHNDLPGVMLAGAIRQYANRHAVAAGRRIVLATNNDSAYLAALDLVAAGAPVAVICGRDVRACRTLGEMRIQPRRLGQAQRAVEPFGGTCAGAFVG